jgi:hypothetical protein
LFDGAAPIFSAKHPSAMIPATSSSWPTPSMQKPRKESQKMLLIEWLGYSVAWRKLRTRSLTADYSIPYIPVTHPAHAQLARHSSPPTTRDSTSPNQRNILTHGPSNLQITPHIRTNLASGIQWAPQAVPEYWARPVLGADLFSASAFSLTPVVSKAQSRQFCARLQILRNMCSSVRFRAILLLQR